MKFGYQPKQLLRSLTRENLVQKMLIALGIVGVVSVYSFQEKPQTIKKGVVLHGSAASIKAVSDSPATATPKLEEVKPNPILGKYLLFKEIVEPGMVANFEIMPLPGGAKYTINFGDGSPEANVNGLKATHVYRRSGDFQVTLTADFNCQKRALPPLKIHVLQESEVDASAGNVEM